MQRSQSWRVMALLVPLFLVPFPVGSGAPPANAAPQRDAAPAGAAPARPSTPEMTPLSPTIVATAAPLTPAPVTSTARSPLPTLGGTATADTATSTAPEATATTLPALPAATTPATTTATGNPAQTALPVATAPALVTAGGGGPPQALRTPAPVGAVPTPATPPALATVGAGGTGAAPHLPRLGALVVPGPLSLPTPGIITTVAGVPGNGGCGGSGGDGGPATQASLGYPHGVAVDAQGDLFITDNAWNRVREVVAGTGLITTVVGQSGCDPSGYSGDGGPATAARLFNPSDLAFDGAGNLYIVDNHNQVIREVLASTGIITTVAGNGTLGSSGDGGAARAAELNDPNGVAVDSAGNLYIADTGNNRVRKVDALTQVITTVAGTGGGGDSGDGGAATAATVWAPFVVRLDSAGTLYIAERFGARVRKVSSSTGIISTVAGGGTCGAPGCGDGGPATQAVFGTAIGLAVDSAGTLFVTDDDGSLSPTLSRVREVLASTGLITAFAGSTPAGYSGDGGPATAAQLRMTYGGLALDGAGNLYIADDENFAVRVVGGAGGRRLGSGTIPWHPHHDWRLSDRLSASVDLVDGHVDVHEADLSLPGLGPPLSVGRTWDSLLAQAGRTTAAGTGWVSDLTPSIGPLGGVLTGTVVYTDSSGAQWSFGYTGTPTAPPPSTGYSAPPGFPWTLTVLPTTTAATAMYTLTNLLDGAVQTFDLQGRYLSERDAYGNGNTLAYGSSGGPSAWSNSGGRALSLQSSTAGLVTTIASPLFLASSGAAGQYVAYGFGGGQLRVDLQAAGQGDQVETQFGYSGALLTSLTTGNTQVWTLGYDSLGRLSSVTSPAQGTPGQAGYTPAYTTSLTYLLTPAVQTQVVAGAGTSAALTTTYTLDVPGEASAVADGLGNTTYTTYDADHDVLSTTDSNGHVTTNSYASVGPGGSTGLLSATVRPPIDGYCPGCGPTTVVLTNSYSAAHDLSSTLSPNGWLTTYGYDGQHSMVTTTQQLQICQPTCDTPVRHPRGGRGPGAQPLTLGTIAWRGSVTLYDAHGEVTGTVDGRGVSVGPDGVAQPLVDPGPFLHLHGYDAQGDLVSETTPPIATTLGGTVQSNQPVSTTYTYDLDGNRVSMTAPNGYPTTYSYDHLGRLVQTQQYTATLYDGTVTQPQETTAYDGDGNVIRAVDGNGDVTLTSYDPLGRVISTTNPVGATTLYTYTATEKQAEQDAAGNVTSYGYDAAGRLTSTTDPLLGTTQTAYDAAGNPTTLTSPGGSPIEVRGYDGENHLVTDTIEGPLGALGPMTRTLTAYDPNGNVTQQVAPNGDVTTDGYDGADELLQVGLTPVEAGPQAPPQGQVYEYDNAGDLVGVGDWDGRLTTFTYDGDNRQTGSLASINTLLITTTAAYDPDGNPLTTTTQAGSQSVVTDTATYNPLDWQTNSTNKYSAATRAVSYTYGLDGAGQQRTQLFAPRASQAVTATLDAEGLERTLTDTLLAPPFSAAWSYTPNDQPLTETVAGAVLTQTQGYDANSRLVTVTAQNSTAALSTTYTYGYLPVGWTSAVTTITGTAPGTPVVKTFSHDTLGRLVGAQTPGGSNSWSYDGDGNVLQYVNGTTTYTYGYTGTPTYPTPANWLPGELLVYTNTATGKTDDFGYDASGHTTAISTTGGYSETLAYDSQGRTTGVHVINGSTLITAALGYNASGLRTSYALTRTGALPTTLTESFLYRDGQIGAVSVISNGVSYTETFIYDQQGQPLELIDNPAVGTTVRYLYVHDGRGNVVALTDASGNVVNSYSYDVWGNLTAVSETINQPYRYAGYWDDQDLGWYWLSVRYYSPGLERFLQPDPSMQEGVRSYVYVRDDPLDAQDPSGLMHCYSCGEGGGGDSIQYAPDMEAGSGGAYIGTGGVEDQGPEGTSAAEPGVQDGAFGRTSDGNIIINSEGSAVVRTVRGRAVSYRLNRKTLPSNITGQPESTDADASIAEREAAAAAFLAARPNVREVYLGKAADTYINGVAGSDVSADVVARTYEGKYYLAEAKGRNADEIFKAVDQLRRSADKLVA